MVRGLLQGLMDTSTPVNPNNFALCWPFASGSRASGVTKVRACTGKLTTMGKSMGEDPNPMSQMQMKAFGLTLFLSNAQCFQGMPLPLGGVLLCCILLVRSVFSLFAGASLSEIAFRELRGVPSPQAFVLLEGICDAVAAFSGILGLLLTSCGQIVGFMLWISLHGLGATLLLPTFVLALTGIPDVARWMGIWPLCVVACALALDLYLVYVGLQLFFLTVLRGSASPSARHFMAEAQRTALACEVPGAGAFCARRHLVMALLRDPAFRDLMQAAGAAVYRMEADLPHSRPDASRAFTHWEKEVDLPFAEDVQVTLCKSVFLQKKAGEERLRAEHLILALCEGGIMEVPVIYPLEPNNYPEVELPAQKGVTLRGSADCAKYWLDEAEVQEELAVARMQSLESRPTSAEEGARVLGCLPLEEVVAVYAAARAVAQITSLCCMAFLGHSWDPLLGLRDPPQLRPLEVLEGLLGALCGTLGLYGIAGHRRARAAVRNEAYRLGVRWGAELSVAFDTVRMEPAASEWHSLLQRGANLVGLLWLWTVLELFLDVPVLGLCLVEGNICGVYTAGLAGITGEHLLGFGTTTLRCSQREAAMLTLFLAGLSVKAYLCWVSLALWHLYAHGWTTMDLRGAPYLMSFTLIPERLALALAGMPFQAQGCHDTNEARPLLA